MDQPPHDAGRRSLHFANLQELLDEAERLAVGEPQTRGKWSAGQIFLHLARSFDGSIDGIPGFKLPWPLRLVGPLFKRRLMRGPYPRGVKVPAAANSYLVPGPTSTAAGLIALQAAVARWQRAAHVQPHPLAGRLTIEEWTEVHLRHAEHHLGNIWPG